MAVVISANTPLSKDQVAERTGLRKEQISGPLKELVTAGRIVGEGATVKRRYRAAAQAPHSQAGARTAAGRERNAAQLTDAVARIGLRERVMKAVSADPCRQDNNTLARDLDAHPEDIADACQWLIDHNRLQMHKDGTYLRSVAEAARQVA